MILLLFIVLFTNYGEELIPSATYNLGEYFLVCFSFIQNVASLCVPTCVTLSLVLHHIFICNF